ncbi:MAG: cytochrome c biogenesis protein CcsA [Fuerstiella sp.]
MSTTMLPGDSSSANKVGHSEDRVADVLRKSCEGLASMKLTVVLFLLGMFLVFVGSLAQARHDVWQVVHQYFRTFVAWIDVADFFPPSMFPGLVSFDWDSLGKLRFIPFPGGWTIGWIMLANLLTAHALRFKVRAVGGRLFAGVAIMFIGAVLTGLVVWTGNQQTGVEYGATLLTPEQVWYLMLGVMGVAAAVPLGVAFGKSGVSGPERVVLATIGISLGAVLIYFIAGGEDARLNLSSMRILWQLLKGLACAIVILIGANLLFEKRGGIVVLHIGVALLMFSELQVGMTAKENMLALKEGETSSFMRDTRERELAIVHRVDGKDHVVAISEIALVNAAAAEEGQPGRVIELESLPFNVRVNSFLRNSGLRSRLPDDEATTTGLGTFAVAVEKDPVTGMDDAHDMSAIQISLLDKETGEQLQSLLCAQDVSETRTVPIAEQVKLEDKDYQFYLRFQRNYKSYEVELLDVSRTNYVGTATPRDYRSQIIIRDSETGQADEFALWMNNPLRYKGETFYQSGYNELPDGTEMTTLSVVRNTGWMLPYIACMIVAVGMFAQFGLTLGRYLSRFDRAKVAPSESGESGNSNLPAGIRASKAPETFQIEEDSRSQNSKWPVVVPLLLVLLGGAWLGSKVRPPKDDPDSMNLYSFAQVPVAWKGRPQPIDSFARTELLMASYKSMFTGELSAAELDHPKKHKQIVDRIVKYWPSVKAESLADFSGEYVDWIGKVQELTSSGEDAVEERLRDVMTARMPAVRWFLDVVARPELARRHRIIKIDDDQVLSLLGLEKRAGLVYSLEEIQANLSELEQFNNDGLKLEMQEQQHRMTQLQRRVVKLFRTVGRVESLQNYFLVRSTDGLLDSMVTAWWVLERLGNSPAIMAVPTGLDSEQRSWETLIGASAIHNVAVEFREAGLSNAQDVKDYIKSKLPRKLVVDAVSGSAAILQASLETTAKDEGTEVAAGALKLRAQEAATSIQDPFLKRILTIIGNAEAGATVDEMVAGLSDTDFSEIATERTSSDLFQVFETLQQRQGDKRLEKIRSNLRAIGVDDEKALASKMNEELVDILLVDLESRAGGLVYTSDKTSTFAKSTESMVAMLSAWKVGDVEAFNASVKDYRGYLASTDVKHMDASLLEKEAFFNFYEPFMKAIYLYLPILILSFLCWIVWPKVLRNSGLLLMILAFALHSYALIVRMQISGRPPVTNLYSSAIFIGWAVVGAAIFMELFLKNGIGNIVGASVGAASLMIAHYLSLDEGDTLGVMQAVLDTQFWLATHVVCITLGYAATFAAGFTGMGYLGLLTYERFAGPQYVPIRENAATKTIQSAAILLTLGGLAASVFNLADRSRIVGRRRATDVLGSTIYGLLCFALFFSLVGTVLGGLWADDSWGRFWGWDPKENGAMLIVMWNAVILHARWDKMVKDYGTAVLAMFGNIVTAWSWFGVNELKAGLHTYGFTEGRLLALIVFVAIQAIIIGGAMIPLIGRSANKRIDPV